VLIATPEYNHSIPGGLKNALDWASRPFAHNALRGKPAAVVGTSTGLFGAVWAQAETRKVLKAIGAEVVERELPIGSADSAFDADDRLVDPDQRAELAGIVGELAVAADRDARLAAAQPAEAQVL
jgi:chromate reductase